MNISEIKKVSRHNRYEIYADGELFTVLSDMGVIKCGIKLGLIVNEELIMRVCEAQKADALDSLFNILGRTALTKATAKRKLLEKGYNDEQIGYAIGRAEEYGYLNDRAFATSYINANISRSRLRIKNELCSVRGIESAVVEELLADFDEENACMLTLSRSVKSPPDQTEKRRIYQRLAGQGFSYESIKNALNSLFPSADD